MHLLLTSFGVIAIKEPKSEPVLVKKFGEDAETCAKYIKSLENEIKTRKEFEKEIKELLVIQSPERILTNHPLILELVKKHFQESITVEFNPFILPRIKEQIFRSLLENNLIKVDPEQFEKDTAYHLARTEIKAVAEARDVFISQAIHALDDLTATLNLIANRLSEWYGLHFPELSELTRDNVQYMQLITDLGNQENFTKKKLAHLSDTRLEKILKAIKGSLGVEMPEYDLEPVRKLAELGLQTNRSKEFLERYLEEAMQQTAPNISALAGPLIGARLIALAGSLENLAKKPSSTIQVLGAEKALFRALKTQTEPPKHGVLFQNPLVHQAPLHQRGKIARALAAKLSMAARIDFFSGEFLADELKASLDQRIKVIQEQYADAPKPKKISQPKKKDRRKREPKRSDRTYKKRESRGKTPKKRKLHQDRSSGKQRQGKKQKGKK
ncbi:MAG: NOP5/NOP56 family protein [Promethearchaeota archaeon]